MKPIPLLLALSLVANLALAVVFFRSSPESPPSLRSLNPQLSTLNSPPPPPSSGSQLPSLNSQRSPRTLWDSVGSEDLATLVANLRAAGFPPKLVRAIVTALVAEPFASRNISLWAGDENTPYWKNAGMIMSGTKEWTEMQRLQREQEDRLKSLLGDHVPWDEPEFAESMRRSYGNLPKEKIGALMTIQRDYQEMREKLGPGMGGGAILPADREKNRLLEAEQRADIEKLLTPDELLEYDLRNGSAASRMRGQLSALKLTEAEFRSLFPLYQAAEKQAASTTDAAGAQQNAAARKAAEEQIRQQAKSLLSPARYADFLQANDPEANQENRLAARLAARLGLPLSAAAAVSALKRDATTRADAIRNNNDIPLEARNVQLAALAREAEAQVTAALGARGLNVYREYGGTWLKNLQPRPAPTTPRG